MSEDLDTITPASAQGVKAAREMEGHIAWLDTFTSAALGVLATASGIYTYLGVSSLLDGSGTTIFLAAFAYSVAVSVGIFVFWSYILRLLPSMRNAASYLGLTFATLLGSAAIIAMSSWLNAAALAGSAAVEQHLKKTLQEYQEALETANTIAVTAQGLRREVERARLRFEDLAQLEGDGALSGTAGRGAVFRLLSQKSIELQRLEEQILAQRDAIDLAYAEGNQILTRMRTLTVEQGPVEARSVRFSEESVRLAGEIVKLRQLQVAPLVARAAEDLSASVILPELDGRTASVRSDQQSTIVQIVETLDLRAANLKSAAGEVLALEPPQETAYAPISAADAVIKYASNFVPSWAGAIAIDLLPGVLVFILAVTHAAIRRGREGSGIEQSLTLAELQAAMRALRDIEVQMNSADQAMTERLADPPPQDAEPIHRHVPIIQR
ncbi:MAG: hypothetical protein AAF557_05500 [Pseudomonadota bacterium]